MVQPLRPLAAALLAAVLPACQSTALDQAFDCAVTPNDPACVTPVESACDDGGIMVDASGRELSDPAGRLRDPVARRVFHSLDGCPTDFGSILERLLEPGAAEADRQCDNARTMFVSESAQRLEGITPSTLVRGVTVADCSAASGMENVFFSSFGVQDGRLPGSGLEIMAFDSTSGVFNYYKTFGPKIAFLGNSMDMLEGVGGPTELNTAERACAACHTGGGPIMKELSSPWLHWEDDFQTPGATELRAQLNTALRDENPAFAASECTEPAECGPFGHGRPGSGGGRDLEQVVRAGNRAWNQKRIDRLVAGLDRGSSTVADLLRPLFCSVELNVESNFSGDFVSISAASLIDPKATVGFFSTPSVDIEEYRRLLEANGQTVGLGDFRDTVGGLPSIVRAGADLEYVDFLLERGIVDPELVEDVLLVDFTRPVMSRERCELLEHAPTLSAADLSPDRLRAAFIDSLVEADAQPGTPAGDLLRNLEDDLDDAAATIEVYTQACESRAGVDANGDGFSDFLFDYMSYVSQMRKEAMARTLFEGFPGMLPTDDLPARPSLRLGPSDCTLTDGYVSADVVTLAVDIPEIGAECLSTQTFAAQGRSCDDPLACNGTMPVGRCINDEVVDGQTLDLACSCVDGVAMWQVMTCECQDFIPMSNSCAPLRCPAPEEVGVSPEDALPPHIPGAACQCDFDCGERGDCCEGDDGFAACFPHG